MKYIGIDLGDARVGIATADSRIAFGKTTIPRVELVGYIKNMVATFPDISTIVVGLPYDLYNTDTKQLEKACKVVDKLQNIFPDIEVIWHDERYSSFEADEGFKDHRDDIAAQCILQSYLESHT